MKIWNSWKKWYREAKWYLRLPVTFLAATVLVILCFALLLLGIRLIFVWPIRLLGWWVLLYWVALIVGVVMEVDRAEKKSNTP